MIKFYSRETGMSVQHRNQRPSLEECNEFYHGYLSQVPEGDILELLEGQRSRMKEMFIGISEGKSEYRYAPEKWSIKEMIGHLADAERVLGYRVLRFVRNDATPIPGFEQDDYVASGRFGARDFSDIAEEFDLLRRGNLVLFSSFTDEDFGKVGTASGFPFSVRSLVHIIAGHCTHHRKVLSERYL